VLIAFNTSPAAIDRQVAISTGATVSALAGEGCTRVSAPGSLRVKLAPFGYAVCRIGGAR
jgi:hypothetical protein